jgi:glycosyltransferase involved in cell wall biosynthesis
LLQALKDQTYPASEIVIADAGSRDRTVQVAEGQAGAEVRLVRLGPAYPGAARNAAIRAARNEWVALVDAGCLPDRKWLEELVGALEREPGVEAVFGDYEPLLRTEWDRAQALALVTPPTKSGLRPPVVVSALLRKAAFERVGGFREDLRAAEDLLFLEALTSAGVRCVRAPRAVVRWSLAPGPRAAFRRLRLYSYHHLKAGLFRTWHLRVMAMDLAALAILIGGCFDPRLLGVAALAVGLRVWRSAALRRGNLTPPRSLGPFRLLRVALLLVLADAAVWLGAWDARRHAPITR